MRDHESNFYAALSGVGHWQNWREINIDKARLRFLLAANHAEEPMIALHKSIKNKREYYPFISAEFETLRAAILNF